MSLTYKIIVGMTAGLTIGILCQVFHLTNYSYLNDLIFDGFIDALGQIFIVSLKMMVVPLVFLSLTCGAASLGASGSIGRLGGKTISLYLVTTAIAVSVALGFALLINPGEGGSTSTIEPPSYEPKSAPGVKDTLINIFPDNPVAAMAEGSMLQIIVFALLLGLAISKSGEAGKKVLGFFESANTVMLELIMFIVKLAPYGVFCLMMKLGLGIGLYEILKLAKYFFTVVAVLIFHGLVVYPSLIFVFTKLNPIIFLRKMREALLVAFSTSSSGATMPITMSTVQNKLGVKSRIASFSVPLGATINMDGTAIMQGVATVFIAQFYGIVLTPDQFLMVIITATLASIGTAAVPGVGLIMLTMVLGQVGLPVEGIGLIIGVDRLLDMLRTAVNVTGDGTVAVIVASSEKDLDRGKFHELSSENNK
ncbi:dicarboxylate/amino acid:cation symporter [Betaproteobacteria bacterium]|nr:dicarboxylate/amino acid:cation symporter [Betaproteobacteria bacterium]